MSYNILADELVALNDYTGVNPEHLKWRTRREQIKKELKLHRPHILCL